MHFPVDISDTHLQISSELSINSEDIDEHFTSGHGPGGQKKNKSRNCVELTHRPTGITVRFQHHRGLHRNRVEAYELLILKIEEQTKGIASELGQARHKIEKQKQRRSRRVKEKMLAEKRMESGKKETRKPVDAEGQLES